MYFAFSCFPSHLFSKIVFVLAHAPLIARDSKKYSQAIFIMIYFCFHSIFVISCSLARSLSVCFVPFYVRCYVVLLLMFFRWQRDKWNAEEKKKLEHRFSQFQFCASINRMRARERERKWAFNDQKKRRRKKKRIIKTFDVSRQIPCTFSESEYLCLCVYVLLLWPDAPIFAANNNWQYFSFAIVKMPLKAPSDNNSTT